MRIGRKKIEKVRVYGDPFLSKKAEAVDAVDEKLVKFSEVLMNTMVEFDGVGLAAIQVGVKSRMIALGVPIPQDENGVPRLSSPGEALLLSRMPMVLLNPEIVSYGKELVTKDEGCLSVPDIYAPVTRPGTVVVSAQILGAESFTLECGGLLARAFQHEIDHLDGILFINRLSKDELEKIEPALGKLKRRYARLKFLRKLIRKDDEQ
ncbi:MAG TPA: peptide deformylase [Lentisphaeria bacterium]|nr:MAG: peptide deformylase [Lentisphaerae bacterium GWF2_49_21]HBC87901.1 peptide deformylase [Lentisphaeria bacterium]